MIRNFFLAVITIVISSSVNAQTLAVSANYVDQPVGRAPKFQLLIERESSLILRLDIDNPGGQKLQLEIEHTVLGTVIDTSFSCERFTRRYNMLNADEGKYRIIVRQGKNKIVKNIELNAVTSKELIVD